MKKLINALILLAFISIFAPAAYSEVTAEECAEDVDCVNYYSELGNKNFEILREIRNNYVDEIKFETLIGAFRKGGIKEVFSLLDPHSKYVAAEERAREEEATKPFGGVGMKLGEINKKIVVEKLVENGPAMKSGKIKKGDIILAVGEKRNNDMLFKSTEGVSGDTVVGWIRGEVGKDVVLKLRREGAEPAEFIVILRRELIQPDHFVSKVFGNAGYMLLPKFRSGASREIDRAIARFPENVKGHVLDLRENPGGTLEEANRVSAIFLDRTKLIEKIVERGGPEEYFAGEYRLFFQKQVTSPLVVLVDEFSASASEIVAAALQDHERAVIIGTPTFGKALVQNAYGYYAYSDDEYFGRYWADLLQGDSFFLTTGRIYRPNGRTLQGKGLVPDIVVVNGGGDDIEKMMLERAISERTLQGHLRGEEEGALTPDEKAKLDILKEDRQLYVALEVIKIMSAKENRSANVGNFYELTFVASSEELNIALKKGDGLRGLAVRSEFYDAGNVEMQRKIDDLVKSIQNELRPIFVYGPYVKLEIFEKWFYSKEKQKPIVKKENFKCKPTAAGVFSTVPIDEKLVEKIVELAGQWTGANFAMCDDDETYKSEKDFRDRIDNFWRETKQSLKEEGWATLN